MKTKWTTKVFSCLLALTLMCALAAPAFALTCGASISGASGQRGSTVSLGISVSPDGELEAMGFSLSYDHSVLEWVSGSWSAPNPLIATTDATGGAWGSTAPQSVGGQVVTMTFRIKDDAPIGSSGVNCSVKIASGSDEYTTSASTTVTVICDHAYGEWSKLDGSSHQRTCTKCGTPDTQPHAWGEPQVTAASTCKEQGTAIYTCTVCGETKTEQLPLADHTWNAGEVTVQPTCKDTGVKAYACTVCGVTREETIPTTSDHVYGGWEKNDANTHKHVCTVCGKPETQAHAWDAGKIIQQPTCGATGEKSTTCTICGQVRENETIPATGKHTWGPWQSAGESEHQRICSTCQQTEKLGHSWDAGKVTKQPTCMETGEKTFTCTDCGRTKTETLPVTNEHKWSSWVTNGTAHERSCTVCQKQETAAHTWDAGKVTTEPDCKNTGVKTFTCTACSTARTETIPVTSTHTWGSYENVNAATHKQVCAVCGREAAAAHTWDAGKITKQPTCKEPGVKTFTCTACSAARTEVVPVSAEGHVWGEWKQTKAPTCTEAGAQIRICTLCNASEAREVAATNHPSTVTRDARKATCTENGYSGDKYCTECGALVSKGVALKAAGHSAVTRDEKAATCSETGYSGDTYCKVCGVRLKTGVTVSKTAHTWNTGTVTKLPSADADGEKTLTCIKCGAVTKESIPKGTVLDGKTPIAPEAKTQSTAASTQADPNPKTGETATEHTGQPVESAKDAQKPAQKKSIVLPVLLILISILLLAALAVVLLYLRKHGNSGKFAR